MNNRVEWDQWDPNLQIKKNIQLWARGSTVTVMYGDNERTVQLFHRRDGNELSKLILLLDYFTMVIITFLQLKKIVLNMLAR